MAMTGLIFCYLIRLTLSFDEHVGLNEIHNHAKNSKLLFQWMYTMLENSVPNYCSTTINNDFDYKGDDPITKHVPCHVDRAISQ